MKYRVMSVALAVSLALCPQPVFAAKAGNGGLPPPGWLRLKIRNFGFAAKGTSPAGMVAAVTGGTTAEYTTGTSSLSSGPLAVVGKIGADIAQQQARVA